MLSDQIKAWRQAKSLKQAKLAVMLGVTQATVSRWEAGQDEPSRELRARLLDLIAGDLKGTAPLEQKLIEHQLGYRILVETSGVRMLGLTRQLRELWPDFTVRVGQYLEDYCVNEAAQMFGDPVMKAEMLSGNIAFLSGASERHLSLREGHALKHRWTATFRKDGSRSYFELDMQPCEDDVVTGIHQLLRLDDLIR